MGLFSRFLCQALWFAAHRESKTRVNALAVVRRRVRDTRELDQAATLFSVLSIT